MNTGLRLSAADLGTNTLKVTHALRTDQAELLNMQHYSDTVRLGFGIEKSGQIEPERIDACLDFLIEQERIGREYGSTDFIGVATEALRIAANGQDLMTRIHTETAWKIRIITGAEEARLTYVGLQDQIPADGTSAIADIGGGSTEIVAIAGGEVTFEQSIPVGSGRLSDRFFTDDPPGVDAVEEARLAALEALALLRDAEIAIDSILLAGGSGLFMNMLIEAGGGDVPFDLDALRALGELLARQPADQTVEMIDIPLARAKVLPASVAVAIATMEITGASTGQGVPSGIRMGLIREYSPEAWRS